MKKTLCEIVRALILPVVIVGIAIHYLGLGLMKLANALAALWLLLDGECDKLEGK